MEVTPIRMNLLENSYDFLNESLRAAVRAEADPHAWKFAVLNAVQAIELLLKARLQKVHPVLIYENVDNPGRTVSLTQAVGRVTGAARIPLTSREQFFRREIVLYNGIEVSREWPAEVMAAQQLETVELHGVSFKRLRRGTDWPSYSEYPCHDCGIVDGQLHVPNCDMETCPRCFGQLITCGCLWDEGPPDAELIPMETAFAREQEMYERIRAESAAQSPTES